MSYHMTIIIGTQFFSIVPQHNVEIRRSHTDTVYAGTKFTLNVDISLISIGVKATLNVTWSRGNDVIVNDTRIAISGVSGSGDNYTASLTYSPITTSDSGHITANVSLYVGPYESICSWTSATDTDLLVHGIEFLE